MAWNIESFDPHTASEDKLRARYDLDSAEHEEFWSEDPRTPYEQWKKEMLETVSWRKRLRWVAWDDDGTTIVGSSGLGLGYTETNRHLGDVDVYVRPEHRRQGLALALLAPVVEAAEADGRTILGGGAPTDTAGTDFAVSVGGERKIVERKSRMVVAGVDRAMLEGWVERARERAQGYSLMQWDGPVPDEYLDRFVRLSMVMNTAPRDDLEMDDWVNTPERLREREALGQSQGYTWWTVVVRHDETDELVGYTEFVFPPTHPDVAWQEATAVDPVHRGKGIGRWVKATNALRLMDERPGVRYVDTWNAYSNDPMLAINIAMGFEVVKSYSDFQIPTERLARAIRERVPAG